MDILRALSSPNVDICRKTLEVAMDLVTPRNIEEVVQVRFLTLRLLDVVGGWCHAFFVVGFIVVVGVVNGLMWFGVSNGWCYFVDAANPFMRGLEEVVQGAFFLLCCVGCRWWLMSRHFFFFGLCC